MTKRSIVNVEIVTKNWEESAKFYSDLFGWESQHIPDFDYTTFTTGSIPGGFPMIGDQYKAGDVIVYIESDDLAADLKNIEKHGGKSLGPVMDIPGFGSMAFFSDPTGNRIALWKQAPATPQA